MIYLPDSGNKYSSGQALLLVLLSMAVVLTVVLSILSRSITDIAVTSRDEEALRAFSAAEAGVERALIAGSDTGVISIGDASFFATVSGFSEGGQEFAFPLGLLSGESTLAWFVSHTDDGTLVCNAEKPCFTGSTLKVCWGKPGTASDASTTPAIEAAVFYAQTPGNYSTMRIARETVDPNLDRRSVNSFSSPDGVTCQIAGESFAFQKTLDLSSLGVPSGSYNVENGLQFARLRMFYNTDTSHPVGVGVNFPGGSLLPAQGIKIDATGSAGESTRRLEVFQSFGEVPPIFDGAVFSLGGLSK